MNIYNDVAKMLFDFIKLSLDEHDDNKRFSNNWTAFYYIENENESDSKEEKKA